MSTGLIDFHSHFFSRAFYEGLAKLSPLPGSIDEKLSGVAQRAQLELPPASTAEHLARWTAEWQRHGLEHAVSFASIPEEAPVLAEAATLAGGRMTPFALTNPLALDAPAKARALLERGPFKGLLLFPAMHRYRLDGPELEALLTSVHDLRPILVVHCGLLQVKLRDLLSIPRTYDFTLSNPLTLAPAANRHPTLNFVIPHFGAGYFRETLMLGSVCDNIHLDTSSSNSWIATQEQPISLDQVLSRALKVFTPERILFGTDSSTFPRGWRADLLSSQRNALATLNLPAADQSKILSGNARRLLNLAAP